MNNQNEQEQILSTLKEIRDILKADTKSQIIFSVFIIGMSAIIAGLVKIPIFSGLEILIAGFALIILAICLSKSGMTKGKK